jgi:SH3-like domain-containing protein
VQAYVVSGTDVQGLILRSGPGTENQALKTLPEGTRIEFLGEEQQGGDYVWLRVRDPEGTEGWVARDFTQPAQ